MSWLLRDGDVLAAIEPRRRGWAGSLQGALVIQRPALLQTVTVRASLDVAWCGSTNQDGQDRLEVRRIGALGPYRLVLPQLGSRCLLVASRGSFDRWRLRIGDRLEIRQV
ncbi:MAG: hypothetical protein JO337_07975 [Acidimicrobiales bacterium]|nr:hypothetical protein [Acidimicrobiales bacterium]